MPAIKQATAEFLAGKRVAVTGVSRTPQGHGSNVVYQRLRQRGYEVFAVNPQADQVEGDRCYPDLTSIPGGVDWVVIGTRPQTAEATIRECADLGITRVWMHRGPGAGSVSHSAAEYGRQRGITVIEGGCPCMFGPTADPATRQCGSSTPSPATCHGTCNTRDGGREPSHMGTQMALTSTPGILLTSERLICSAG
jgi:predicted CoA-binding protein